MKIEYICHACLLVDTGDTKIATDPWFHGPAYCGQWHVFPKPVNIGVLKDADVILVSHGHEDHLHEPSLQQLPKSARVFYPYTWYGGTAEYLKQMGFHDVVEAQHLSTYRLSADTSVTYVVNRMDSVIVIESKGEVFVNINDALHSAPLPVVDPYLRELKRRWPRIDAVFCGFGGANYFPNTVHCPGKNDVEIGEVREQLFARNFCHIVKELDPAVAVPFAADFALLHPRQRWINDLRFPRWQLPECFRQLYPDGPVSRILPMFSGDVLSGHSLEPLSAYRGRLKEGNFNRLVEEQYHEEMAKVAMPQWVDEAEATALEVEMLENITVRARLFDDVVLGKIRFTVKASDVSERPFFNVSFPHGCVVIERSCGRSDASLLELESTSRILRHSFASQWGGDALTIGYGCEIQVFDQETLTSNLDTICVRLLTRHPSATRLSSLDKLEPVRWARHLLEGPAPVRAYLKNALNELTRETLFRPHCEACRACDYLFRGQASPVANLSHSSGF